MTVTLPVKVRYAETDRMGIVHHKNYLVWYEEARTLFSDQVGVPYSEIEKKGVMSPLLECGSRYLSSCTYEDELLVECRLVKCTPVQFEYRYRVFKKGEAKPLNTGFTRHAWVDAQTFRPVRLDRRLPQVYEKLLASCEPEETRERSKA
ncbi:MAG: acyl-CoA thioesterase [Bacteroidales bacterium]|nr:acyl-CoA thioesterase [Bacteroidales bacterium]